MKKRLEADLISIAHRILKLKGKSDIDQLYAETQKLYEKLAILRFVDQQLGETKPTIGTVETEVDRFYESLETQPEAVQITPNQVVAEETEIEPGGLILTESFIAVVEEKLAQKANEETVEEVVFTPAFDLVEEINTAEPAKPELPQISFEDLLGGNFDESMFVKVSPLENLPTAVTIEPDLIIDFEQTLEAESQEDLVSIEKEEKPNKSLNESLSKGLNIDLNDRLGFVKHLFGESIEDYNRVLNQIITFKEYNEAKLFLDDMIKPDYNNWEGKEVYEERFMELVEKKFL